MVTESAEVATDPGFSLLWISGQSAFDVLMLLSIRDLPSANRLHSSHPKRRGFIGLPSACR